MHAKSSKVGPRGGKTTRKRGQVKKTLWLDDPVAEALRQAAFDQRRSEASIIRKALREHLGLE